MVKRHLKRVAVPKTWSIKRKKSVWSIRPNAGPHSLQTSLPLGIIIRDTLKHCKTAKEGRVILFNKTVLVNGKRIKDLKHPVGLMDSVQFVDLNQSHRMIFNKKGKLTLIKIDDPHIKPMKITGKTLLKGKLQINFYDGTNMLVAKKSAYHVGDTLVYDLKSKKVLDHIPFQKGATIMLMGGSHIEKIGKISNLMNEKGMIEFTIDKNKYETSTKYAYIIGKEESSITIE